MALVKLYYGPYEANGIFRHRPQRLNGLTNRLTTQGYKVELVPTQHMNRLTVEVFGVTVFCCDIRNLLFNMSAQKDVVCRRALTAIDEAFYRIFDKTNVPKFELGDENEESIYKKGMRLRNRDQNEEEEDDEIPKKPSSIPFKTSKVESGDTSRSTTSTLDFPLRTSLKGTESADSKAITEVNITDEGPDCDNTNIFWRSPSAAKVVSLVMSDLIHFSVDEQDE